MSRQLEQFAEDKSRREQVETYLACVGGLENAIERAGGVLTGFSVRTQPHECLMTLRVVLAGKPQISFVGGETLSSCLRKAVRDAKGDRLRYKPDTFAKK